MALVCARSALWCRSHPNPPLPRAGESLTLDLFQGSTLAAALASAGAGSRPPRGRQRVRVRPPPGALPRVGSCFPHQPSKKFWPQISQIDANAPSTGVGVGPSNAHRLTVHDLDMRLPHTAGAVRIVPLARTVPAWPRRAEPGPAPGTCSRNRNAQRLRPPSGQALPPSRPLDARLTRHPPPLSRSMESIRRNPARHPTPPPGRPVRDLALRRAEHRQARPRLPLRLPRMRDRRPPRQPRGGLRPSHRPFSLPPVHHRRSCGRPDPGLRNLGLSGRSLRRRDPNPTPIRHRRPIVPDLLSRPRPGHLPPASTLAHHRVKRPMAGSPWGMPPGA
jgi:hypothetical protein